MKKQFWFMIITLLLITDYSVYGYDRIAAVEDFPYEGYASRYGLRPNGSHEDNIPPYERFVEDCANFGSQILIAGNWQLHGEAKGAVGYNHTFGFIPDLRNYLVNMAKADEQFLEPYDYSALSGDLKIGDFVLINQDEWDWATYILSGNTNGWVQKFNHTCIVSRVNEDGEEYNYAAHTNIAYAQTYTYLAGKTAELQK